MAIVRGLDGQFYEIPDDQLKKFLVPADKVNEKLKSAGGTGEPSYPPPTGGGEGGGAPTIVVHLHSHGAGGPPPGAGAPPGAQAPMAGGEVSPYNWHNHHWHNHHWHNHHWHNRD